MTFDVLYEDNHLLVVVKPQNVPVQADEWVTTTSYPPTRRYIKERYQKPGAAYLGWCIGWTGRWAAQWYSRAPARRRRQQRPCRAGLGAKSISSSCSAARLRTRSLLIIFLKDETTRTSRVTDAKTQGSKMAHLSYEKLAEKDSAVLTRCCTRYRPSPPNPCSALPCGLSHLG